MVHNSFVRNNWRTCAYKRYCLELSENSKVGHDERNLVKIDPFMEGTKNQNKWKITVFDLRNQGFTLLNTSASGILEFNLHEQQIFNLELRAVLVAKFVAVLCFNGCGEDAPQEFVAIDLSPEGTFQELWRDVSHDWGQFQLLRLFGSHIYKFDLLSNCIDIYNIRTYQKLHSLPLVEQMRYPHGEIAGDGKHLAIPGKYLQCIQSLTWTKKVGFSLYPLYDQN